MVNIEFLKKQIENLDVKSSEFFELYKIIDDKYWTMPDNPSDLQQCIYILHTFAERGTNEEIMVTTKIIEQLVTMAKTGQSATMMTLGFKGRDYYFTLTTDPKHTECLTKVMGDIVKENFEVK